MFKTKRLAPLAVLLATLATGQFACAEEKKSPASGLEAVRAASAKSSTGTLPSDALTFSDLRDVGLCVMQIKQQAINIFMEVTREPLSDKSPAEMPDPNKISDADIHDNAGYLPTRPEWLTFYIGTMEPIIHLFKEDLKDAETGVQKVTVPKGTLDKFQTLFDQYDTQVGELNTHLNNIYDQIAQPNNNVKIAKEAVKLFEVADTIEKDRLEAFKLLQQSANVKEVEPVIPKKKD